MATFLSYANQLDDLIDFNETWRRPAVFRRLLGSTEQSREALAIVLENRGSNIRWSYAISRSRTKARSTEFVTMTFNYCVLCCYGTQLLWRSIALIENTQIYSNSFRRQCGERWRRAGNCTMAWFSSSIRENGEGKGREGKVSLSADRSDLLVVWNFHWNSILHSLVVSLLQTATN